MKKNKFIGVLLALVLSTGTVVSTTVSNKENKLLNPVSSSAVVFSSSPSGIYKVKRNITAAILNYIKSTDTNYDDYTESSVRFCSGDLIYSNGTTVWGINGTSKYHVEYLRCYYYGKWVWVEKDALSLSLRMPV